MQGNTLDRWAPWYWKLFELNLTYDSSGAQYRPGISDSSTVEYIRFDRRRGVHDPSPQSEEHFRQGAGDFTEQGGFLAHHRGPGNSAQ